MKPDNQRNLSPFYFENGFYETADSVRIGKFIAQLELYKKILKIPGHVVECGVLKGNSLIRFAHFRKLMELQNSRKIIGFDMFGAFPRKELNIEKKYLDSFLKETNDDFVLKTDLEKTIEKLGFENFELVEGDVFDSVPAYLEKNPHLRIALLHLDLDLYKPTKLCLDLLYKNLVPGGILMIDDYGVWPGESEIVDEFISKNSLYIKRTKYAQTPCFIQKPV